MKYLLLLCALSFLVVPCVANTYLEFGGGIGGGFTEIDGRNINDLFSEFGDT